MLLAQFLFRGHLEDGEKIQYIAHRHVWIHRWPLFKSLFFGVVAPIGIFFVMPPLYIYWIAWFFIGVIWFMYKLSDWFFDVWLITDKGILDVEWNGIFHRSSTRIEFHTINGVSYEINGFWGTLFKYGRISVDTFGAGDKQFSLDNGANPKTIELEILKNQEKAIEQKSFRDHETLKNMLADMLVNRR